jgi:hypothetical protein
MRKYIQLVLHPNVFQLTGPLLKSPNKLENGDSSGPPKSHIYLYV